MGPRSCFLVPKLVFNTKKPCRAKEERDRVEDEGGETLERVAHRGSGGPIPGNVQGQVGWISEQPGLAEDVPAHCRAVGLDDL